jgi:trehalose 6-phosphate phosphatase
VSGIDSPAPAVFPPRQICMFLDFDGTLVDFAPTPGEVQVAPELVPILRALHSALSGAMALVSGRRIADLDTLLRPLRLPAAGLHGLELRDPDGRVRNTVVDPEALAPARSELERFAASRSGLVLEDKEAALALHYRRAPHLQEIARTVAARCTAPLAPEFELLEGDMVLEIKPARMRKSSAVESFLENASFAGRVPVFVGDDLTDRSGFGAVRRHDGMTVAVGNRITAQWQLPDPQATRAWLARVAEAGAPDAR